MKGIFIMVKLDTYLVCFVFPQIMSDDRYETAELFNLSNIDDQEIADFLLGISGVKQQETKKVLLNCSS